MNSKHMEEELSSYISGELDAAEAEAVERHLSDCALCAAQLKSLEQLNGLLDGSDKIQPTERFTHAVLRKLEEERRVVAFRSRRTIAWLAAAAAIVFAVLLLSIQKENQPPAPITHWKPKIQAPELPAVRNAPYPNDINPQDAELIANLDAVENMDVIDNYDNLEYLEAALIAGEEANRE